MKMNLEEAIKECERWFTRNDLVRKNAIDMQRAASLARAGKIKEAKLLKEHVDRKQGYSPTVYDAEMLEKAVKILIENIKK